MNAATRGGIRRCGVEAYLFIIFLHAKRGVSPSTLWIPQQLTVWSGVIWPSAPDTCHVAIMRDFARGTRVVLCACRWQFDGQLNWTLWWWIKLYMKKNKLKPGSVASYTTSGLETEWDYSGKKGRNGQKKKIGKAIERKRKVEKGKNEVNGQGGRGVPRHHTGLRLTDTIVFDWSNKTQKLRS